MQTAFLVPVNGKLKCILFSDVLFINAKDKYCEIVTVDQKKWLTRVPITYMQEKLPKNLFLRVHRTHIIAFVKIDWLDRSTVEIGGHKLAISKEGYRQLTQKLLLVAPEIEKRFTNEIEATDQGCVLQTFASIEMSKVG